MRPCGIEGNLRGHLTLMEALEKGLVEMRAAELHRAHVATLAADFCKVVGVDAFSA